ncbi:MAG: cation transporting ATPase C-terminal domain-containing protein, partial [Thiomonas sp.]
AVHMPIIALALLPALLHWPVLLLQVHIVLLELLIDPACSIVFEAEPAAADLMRRPPRPLTASPFTLGNIGFALLQGLGIAAVLLVGHAALQAATGWSEGDLRLAVFVALVLALFLLILSNRDLHHAALFNLRSDNPWLWRMFAAVAAVLAAVLLVPGLRDVMGFAGVNAPPMLAALGLLLLCGLWLQGLRLAWGWRLPR